MNGYASSHSMLMNNIHGKVKGLTNYMLFFNQRHVVNHLLNTRMCLMRLAETNKPSMDKVLYHVYTNDEYKEEQDPKLNNTDT